MSKTYSINLAMSFKYVISEEGLKLLRETFEVASQRAQDQTLKLSPKDRAMASFAGTLKDLPDDEAIPAFLTFALRQGLHPDIVDTIGKSSEEGLFTATKFSPLEAKVTPAKVACVVPDPACDCSFCRGF